VNRPSRTLSIEAPAKVNLVLRILAREESGYHQLETLFAAVDFTDHLTVERSEDGISLTVDGPPIGPLKENLAHRAAQAFLRETRLPGGVAIHLEKEIPIGAGLGGGSSDAAAVLKGMNRLFDRPLSREELAALGGSLGADVPFFLAPTTLALAWGRGDRILPLPPISQAFLVLALPPFEIGTAGAFKSLARHRARSGWRSAPRILDPEVCSSWDAIALRAENDFEWLLFPEYPVLEEIRDGLAARGARPALLSGSGSALYGVFGSRDSAESASSELAAVFPEVRFEVCSTLSSSPRPIDLAR
jgi:4-diphosphocytidyl-2-C-methyl-D-erythritol kinase